MEGQGNSSTRVEDGIANEGANKKDKFDGNGAKWRTKRQSEGEGTDLKPPREISWSENNWKDI